MGRIVGINRSGAEIEAPPVRRSAFLLALFLALAFFSVGLAACGGDEEGMPSEMTEFMSLTGIEEDACEEKDGNLECEVAGNPLTVGFHDSMDDATDAFEDIETTGSDTVSDLTEQSDVALRCDPPAFWGQRQTWGDASEDAGGDLACFAGSKGPAAAWTGTMLGSDGPIYVSAVTEAVTQMTRMELFDQVLKNYISKLNGAVDPSDLETGDGEESGDVEPADKAEDSPVLREFTALEQRFLNNKRVGTKFANTCDPLSAEGTFLLCNYGRDGFSIELFKNKGKAETAFVEGYIGGSKVSDLPLKTYGCLRIGPWNAVNVWGENPGGVRACENSEGRWRYTWTETLEDDQGKFTALTFVDTSTRQRAYNRFYSAFYSDN